MWGRPLPTGAGGSAFWRGSSAPPDQRRNRGFDEVAVAVDAKTDVRANVYVVAHLDIGVPDRARTEAALRQLAAAARQSAGNVRFDIWQQTDRANHFNVSGSSP
jgi:hypothetical protein